MLGRLLIVVALSALCAGPARSQELEIASPLPEATEETVVKVGEDKEPIATNKDEVSIVLVFDKPIDSLEPQHLTLDSDTLTSAVITRVAGGGTTWTVTIATGSGDGNLGLSLNAAGLKAHDLPAGEAHDYLEPINLRIDKSPPVVRSIRRDPDAPNPTTSRKLLFLVEPDLEALDRLNGLKAENFSIIASPGIQGASIVSVTQDEGGFYRVEVDAGVGAGQLGIQLAHQLSAVKDDAGNALAVPFTAGESYMLIGGSTK